jgi:hypothetical protein
VSYLLEIDAALDAAGHDVGWLRRKARLAFGGRSPLEHMIAGKEGATAEVLRALTVAGFKASLSSVRKRSGTVSRGS